MGTLCYDNCSGVQRIRQNSLRNESCWIAVAVSAQLIMKASEISSDNSNIRLCIDDLRKEKMNHRDHVSRMKAKAEKMDVDIAFLTHQAHAALDQREKVG